MSRVAFRIWYYIVVCLGCGVSVYVAYFLPNAIGYIVSILLLANTAIFGYCLKDFPAK